MSEIGVFSAGTESALKTEEGKQQEAVNLFHQ
jgi:hypothetical protein